MEALLCTKLGDPTVAISDSSPIVVSRSHPVPAIASPTSVRVRIAATSLNYANYLQILGRYQEKLPLPFVPGSDYSGVVESVGSAVSTVKIGDKVCSLATSDSFCEFIVTDEKELRFLVPDGCDLVAAGALPVAYGTSHLALVHRAQLKPGQVGGFCLEFFPLFFGGDNNEWEIAGTPCPWCSWWCWIVSCADRQSLWSHCYCCSKVFFFFLLKI
ncbi:hypothetical protein ZIOFF_072743 [Zingiber officinale]|uniref:Enoyl reductase (ER) domain-containing protein n=1 Tax=Zingiber officinale TaxID=94328 RepID=A0A8J5C2X8_ZINOF|nr:hypothetical protein ZIOFF_072743 [Zingiber officinale]